MSRAFKITKIRNNTGYDHTIFLPNNLQFKNSVMLNYITFINEKPFNTYKEGDIIAINTEEVIKYSANSLLNDVNIIDDSRGFKKDYQ